MWPDVISALLSSYVLKIILAILSFIGIVTILNE